MKLGRWIGVFRELTQSEEEDAWAVHEERQPGNQQMEIYMETNQINMEKDQIMQFLGGNFDPDQYVTRMLAYLGCQNI